MSTLIALKVNDAVVLATDSLLYDSQERPLSRTQQKVFEVAPGLFYGWSGRKSLAIAQANVAAALSRTTQTGNLRTFAEVLNAASMSHVIKEASRVLAEESQSPGATGELPIHMYVLAGASEGVAGFVFCQFTIKGDEVEWKMGSDFRPATGDKPVHMVTGHLSLGPLLNDPKTWTGGLEAAATQFVDHLRIVIPTGVGGPIQMARIDASGARWVRQPVELHRFWDGQSDGHGGIKVAAGGIDNALLADLAVSSAKIAAGAIETAKIADLSIITSKLAAGAVDNGKLAALAVDAAKLADSAVTTTKIANAAVGSAAIANLAVGTAHIQDAGITNAKIGNLAVSTAKIQDAAITTAKIGTAQITSALIADANITTAKIANGTIVTAHIADAQITTAKVASLDVSKLNAGAIAVGGATVPAVGATFGSRQCNLMPQGVGIVDPGGATAATLYAGTGGDLRLYVAGALKAWLSSMGPDGLLALYDSSGAQQITFAADGGYIAVNNLPSSNPGSGSKRFWYDPADGNRVKFAA